MLYAHELLSIPFTYQMEIYLYNLDIQKESLQIQNQ